MSAVELPQITAEILKAANFSAAALKERGYDTIHLKAVDFD
eukprot:gene20393-14932_t